MVYPGCLRAVSMASCAFVVYPVCIHVVLLVYPGFFLSSVVIIVRPRCTRGVSVTDGVSVMFQVCVYQGRIHVVSRVYTERDKHVFSAPTVYPLCIQDVSAVYPLCIHDVPAVLRFFRDVSVVYPWCIHDVLMVYPERASPLRVFVAYPGCIHGVSTFRRGCAQCVFGVYLGGGPACVKCVRSAYSA
jgi:hypothetical protein